MWKIVVGLARQFLCILKYCKLWYFLNQFYKIPSKDTGKNYSFGKYSRLPITRTFKGNRKKFKLSGVRVIGSSKKIAGSKVKNSFYCTVSILIKFIVEMLIEIWKILSDYKSQRIT